MSEVYPFDSPHIDTLKLVQHPDDGWVVVLDGVTLSQAAIPDLIFLSNVWRVSVGEALAWALHVAMNHADEPLV